MDDLEEVVNGFFVTFGLEGRAPGKTEFAELLIGGLLLALALGGLAM
jgi:hypothetical protein